MLVKVQGLLQKRTPAPCVTRGLKMNPTNDKPTVERPRTVERLIAGQATSDGEGVN